MDIGEAKSHGHDEQVFGTPPFKDLDCNARKGDLCQSVIQACISDFGKQSQHQNTSTETASLQSPVPMHQES